MIGPMKVGRLQAYGAELSGSEAGLSVTVNGEPASFVVLNPEGGIVSQGKVVADVAVLVCVKGYLQFLGGRGWERIAEPVNPLEAASAGARFSKVSHEGLRVDLLDPLGLVESLPGELAILNGSGDVVLSGPQVADELESFIVNALRARLIASGVLRTSSSSALPGPEGAPGSLAPASRPAVPRKPKPRLRKAPKPSH